MNQHQHRQRSIFEAAIGSIEQLVDGLIEPALQRLDEVLADDQLLEAAFVTTSADASVTWTRLKWHGTERSTSNVVGAYEAEG